MKNLFIRLTLFGTIVILLACIACGTAHAQKKRRYKDEPVFIDSSAYFRDGFKVKDFHAEVDVRQDGYFTVTERYDIEFISNYKHGILRTIPLRYIMGDTNGVERKVTITIDSVSVTGRNFKQEADGGNNLVLKIGDPDVYATGRQEYAINYRVKNAFYFRDGQPDFYWNFVPAGWNTVFERSSFSIHLPVKILLSPKDYYVYSGYYGDKAENACIAYEFGTVYGSANGKLPPHNQLTALIHLPKRYVYEATAADRLWDAFAGEYKWAVYPIVLILLYVAYYIAASWKKKKLLVVQVQPPAGIDPAMAGFIINNCADASDIISLIPYWGAAGYITVLQTDTEHKDDTILRKNKSLPHGVPDYQLATFNGIFETKDEVRIRDLEYVFDAKLLSAERMLANAAVANGFYAAPKGGNFLAKMACFIFLAFWGYKELAAIYNPEAGFAWMTSCLVLAVMPLPRRRKKPANDAAIQELMGFKEFLEKAEKDRLQVLLKDDPNYFESTVGYAMALGMLNDWSTKFDDMLIAAPTWYNADGGYTFTPVNFSHQLNRSMQNVRTVMVSARPVARQTYSSYSGSSSGSSSPSYVRGGYSKSGSYSSSSSSRSSSGSSSRGSGYSGGGFGGGGGGSW